MAPMKRVHGNFERVLVRQVRQLSARKRQSVFAPGGASLVTAAGGYKGGCPNRNANSCTRRARHGDTRTTARFSWRPGSSALAALLVVGRHHCSGCCYSVVVYFVADD